MSDVTLPPDAWVIDPSSYRIDKTSYLSFEEARQKAYEAARILGRPISIYQLMPQDFAAENTHPSYDSRLVHHSRVMPNGELDVGPNPRAEHKGEPPAAPVALGKVLATLDEVAEELEALDEQELADEVDELSSSFESNAYSNRDRQLFVDYAVEIMTNIRKVSPKASDKDLSQAAWKVLSDMTISPSSPSYQQTKKFMPKKWDKSLFDGHRSMYGNLKDAQINTILKQALKKLPNS